MPFVLDCSVTMSWVFPDEATGATDALRQSLVNDMAVAPVLWPLEVGNVLLVATRRGRIHMDDWKRIHHNLAVLPIEVDPETPDRVWPAILPLAMEYNLSVYDAAYLELAVRYQLPLATLDGELRAACRAAKIDTLLS